MKPSTLVVASAIFAISGLLVYDVLGKASGVALEVITYNAGTIAGKRLPDQDVVAAVEGAGKVDLVILQEVGGEEAARAIAEKLGLRHCVFRGYHDGKRGDGLALISRYPLRNPSIHHPKACLHAWLSAEMLVQGKTVMVCSMHLQRISSVVIDEKQASVNLTWHKALHLLVSELTRETPRALGVDEFLTWLESQNADRIIIGGDFNTVPFSTAIRKMGDFFQDALWPKPDYLTGTYQALDFPVMPRIDYIFSSPAIGCRSASVIRRGAGDHRPVRAVLNLG